MSAGADIPTQDTTVHPGDSSVQSAAEPLMIEAVGKAIGVPLVKQRIDLGNSVWCEVDGVSADGMVLVEAFAHQGKMIGGQLKKVSEDALKLVTITKVRPGARLMIAFADEMAAKSFMGKSWKAEALRLWGVDVLIVELHDDVRAGISTAQVRQYR